MQVKAFYFITCVIQVTGIISSAVIWFILLRMSVRNWKAELLSSGHYLWNLNWKWLLQKVLSVNCMVSHCSTQEREAGGSKIQGHWWLHNEFEQELWRERLKKLQKALVLFFFNIQSSNIIYHKKMLGAGLVQYLTWEHRAWVQSTEPNMEHSGALRNQGDPEGSLTISLP